MDPIRRGDRGPQVADVQRRLAALGVAGDDEMGLFGEPTRVAVRLFQQQRNLTATGEVNAETWEALVEAGHRLGDRLLYATRPMQVGDDVRELQQRLNALGFDAGQVDGMLGDLTDAAIREFQLNVGLVRDGIVGPATTTALLRLHRSHQSAAAARVREREALRRGRRSTIVGARIVVDPAHGPDHPGHTGHGCVEHEIAWAVANRVRARLTGLGALAYLTRGPLTSPPTSERARLANQVDADVVVSIGFNAHPTPAANGSIAQHFGTELDVSDAGARLAGLLQEAALRVLGGPDCGVHPSTRTMVRATRAPSAIVEPGFLTGHTDGPRLQDPSVRRDLGDAFTDAVRVFLTRPSED